MTNKLTGYIERELENRNWSMRELSRRSGLSVGTISDVMNDRANPGLRFCQSVARAFNVPTENILSIAGLLPKRTTRNEQVRSILRYYDQMTPDDQKRILDIARTLAERPGEGRAVAA